MKTIIRIFTIGLLLCLSINQNIACTIIKATHNGTTFIGNNEDGTDPITFLWFKPASKNKYGCIYFTLSDKWPQGGMNDQGLFYDGTAGPVKEILNSKDKPVFNGNLSQKMLEECADVDEAIALLRKYNLEYFWNGQMFLADKYGNSAIIEGDTIIYSEKSYQVATNFYHSNPGLGGFPCYRYDVAEAMVQNLPELSFNTVRHIMQAVHLEGYSFTQYSTIHDLKNLRIQYFKDSDFKNYIEIDLKKEFEKGERRIRTKDFFNESSVKRITGNEPIFFDGTVESYHSNGKLKCRLNFTDNILNGSCEGYYPNANRSWCSNFQKGKICGALSNWNESGKPLVGYNFINNNNTVLIDYFPSGEALLNLTLRNEKDKIEPVKITVHNQDGSISFKGRYNNGKLFVDKESKPFSGMLTAKFTNQSPFVQYEYKNGLLHGNLHKWDVGGRLIKTEVFNNGSLRKVLRYN